MSAADKHKVRVACNNCCRKIVFNACWQESVKLLHRHPQDFF